MNFNDPSEQNLPDDFRRSPLGELSVVPATPPTLRLGAPFSERLDRSIDEIVSPPAGGAAGGAAFTFPFQITDVSVDPDPIIHVRYGTLNDIVPINDDTDITIPGDGTWTFFLDVNVDEDAVATIISVTLTGSTSGQPADDDDHAYITIGQVIVAGGVITTINQAATHSLRFAACNRVAADPEADPPVVFARGQYEFWGF